MKTSKKSFIDQIADLLDRALLRELTPSFLSFRLRLRCAALRFGQLERLTTTHLGLLGRLA